MGLTLSAALIEWSLRRVGDTSGHLILFGVPAVLVGTLIVSVSGARVWLDRRYRALFPESRDDEDS